MSVDIRITNYKDADDKQKQINEYNAYLTAQNEINRMNAEAMDTYYRNKKFDIPPAPAQKKTAEEELADSVLQRDKAIKSLKEFMKETDATNALFELQTHDEVGLFNRFAELFIRDIKGQKNISPLVFHDLWERYKQKLIATGNTGIPIGTEPGEYKADLANIEALIISSGPTIAMRIDDMRKDAAVLAGLDQKAIDTEVNRVYEDENKRPIENPVKGKSYDELDIPIPSAKKFVLYQVGIDTRRGVLVLNKKDNKKKSWDLRNNEKIQWLLYKKYGVPIGLTINWTGDPSTVFVPASTVAVSSRAPKGTPAVRPAIKGTGTFSTLLNNRHHEILKPVKHFKIGSGFEEVIIEPLNIDKHFNKPEASIKQEPNFGKYVLSLNALKKGQLHIRYPSGANIPTFPKLLISSVLRKILNDILFEKRFEEDDYEELDEHEKKVFDDLLTMCKADKKDCVLLYKHKKYTDKQRDADIKRFNILKGELIAGNDNPEIIKELKSLLFRMMSEKTISRAEYNKILEKIFTLI